MRVVTPLLATFALCLLACGPAPEPENAECPQADLETDILNCGQCGTLCGAGQLCSGGNCTTDCTPGDMLDCYDAAAATDGVGPCHGGQRICQPSGTWGQCVGQLLPSPELCGNGVDDDCSGMIDENIDNDLDGFATCENDCCDSTAVCGQPELVNPGAFDAIGNDFDDDCDGAVDNPELACDIGLPSSPSNALDYARAIDLCQIVTEESRQWGVITATLSLANGQGNPGAGSHSIRPNFGTGLTPQSGLALALFSSGTAAGVGQTNPSHVDFERPSQNWQTSSPFPADWLAANGGLLPNAPGCPAPTSGSPAQDPVMLTLRVRAPSNAKSFSFAATFYSAEFPEWVCSAFNDFFVVLLDSSWTGTPANPADKNLAFYRHPTSMQIYPVGVNLGSGNTGLFTQCVNGETGCFGGSVGSISTCQNTDQLIGTGFDIPSEDTCDFNSLQGGATGWLQTSGNVVGGEIFTLRIAIWDTSDHVLDSLVAIDNFQWSVDATDPGTIPD